MVWGRITFNNVSASNNKSATVTYALNLTTKCFALTDCANVALVSRINGTNVAVKNLENSSQSGTVYYVLGGEI